MDEQQWAEVWLGNRQRLDAVWRDDLRRLNTREALLNLASAFNYAVRSQAPRPGSGLVEMQRLFHKTRQ